MCCVYMCVYVVGCMCVRGWLGICVLELVEHVYVTACVYFVF